ncbi:hypothetical protein EOPP23_20255 [Endozoicomonas sp. OPT23]|nr:hypothetical protein [Endozoicomonas sp. OPT23]
MLLVLNIPNLEADQTYLDCLGALQDESIIRSLFESYQKDQSQGLLKLCQQCQPNCEKCSKKVVLIRSGKDMEFTVTSSRLGEHFYGQINIVPANQFPVGKKKLFTVRKDCSYRIFNHGADTSTIAVYCEYEVSSEPSSPEPQLVPGSPFDVQFGLGDVFSFPALK